MSYRSKSIVGVLVCSLVLCATAAQASLSQALQYKLKDAKTGAHVDLAKLKGKYKAIYLDFFASWCAPCQLAIPEVIKMHNRLGSKGVDFIGIDTGDKWDAMQKDIKQRGINYRVLHDEKGTNFQEMLGIEGIPVVIILDGKTLQEKGRWVAYDMSGGHTRQQLALLKKLGVKG